MLTNNHKKILELHNRGWNEDTNRHTTWGEIVVGYFNVGTKQRIRYLRFLKKLPHKDGEDVYIKNHIDAILQAMDIVSSEEEYGGYAGIFTGKVKVYDISSEDVNDYGKI